MSSTPQGPYGLQPPGQPAPLRDGEWEPAAPRPALFGMGARRLRGVPKILVVPQPAAGADWIYNFAGPSWYLFHFAVALLTASAAVVTRTVLLQFKYTGVLCGLFASPVGQTAGQAFTYSISGSPFNANAPGFANLPVVDDVIVKDSMSIGTSTTNLQAGDQWSAIALYLEEFTDACIY